MQKLKEFFKEHEDIAQLVKFTLFSLVAFAIEYISFTIILLCLKGYNQDAVWWIFKYTSEDGGMGAMIAFFVSNVLAQVTTFIINRKKTFHATNNLLFSATAYTVMVCGIILLNTYLGAVITTAASKTIANQTVCQYIGKLTGSVVAFAINFLGCKFVVMRNFGKKNTEEKEEASLVADTQDFLVGNGQNASETDEKSDLAAVEQTALAADIAASDAEEV